MIRKYLCPVVPALCLLLSACVGESGKEGSKAKEKPNLSLSGNFTNGNLETVYLFYLPVTGEQKIDSVKLDENGNFSFTDLHIPGSGFYTLKINDQQFCPLVLEPNQTVKVTGDAQNLGYTYVADGSADTKVYQEIADVSMRHKSSVDSLGADFQTKLGPNNMNKEAFNTLSAKYEGVYNQMNEKFYKDLISIYNSNPSSLACIAAVGQLDPNLYIVEYKKLDENLAKKYDKEYSNITTFHEQVSKYSLLAIGSVAPDLNLQDPNGNTISLSSLRGKVVLIDFWASWCKPCLHEAPNIVKIYNQYKNKGFEIYGVSLDQKKEDWMKAIGAYNLTWKHVCDFGGWYSPAAKTYDVTAIPYTILLDKEGRIINKSLRGEQLGLKLKELLGS